MLRSSFALGCEVGLDSEGVKDGWEGSPTRGGSCLSALQGEAPVFTAVLEGKNVAMKHGPGLCSRLLRLTEPSVHRGLGPQHSPLDSRPGGVGVKGKEGEWPRGPMETRGQNWKTSLSDKSITTLIVRKRGLTLGL